MYLINTINRTLLCNYTAGEFKIKNFNYENGKESFKDV